MTEFETIKTILERTGDELKITVWKVINEALIENLTEEVDFWFKDGKLSYMENNRYNSKNYWE